ncbi:MAG: hypothetical protein Roseis2KO_29320 [Roseivirga sp.]
MSKRTTISNGIAWVRYIWGFFTILFFSNIFSEGWQTDLILTLIFAGLTGLFYNLRRVKFDDGHIYRIYGKRQKVVSFADIKRIEKSGAKLNGRRMWRLRYDNDGKEDSFLFIDGIFQHGSVKELIKKVRAVNPALQVEESHIWNQVEQQKRRKARRQAKREGKA